MAHTKIITLAVSEMVFGNGNGNGNGNGKDRTEGEDQ
jgi:hypothetical protein